MDFKFKNKDEITLVLGGEAGQGIQTVEQILLWAFKMTGFNVCATKEYMSRVRGGQNSTQIRVSNQRVSAFREHTDLLVALSPGALEHLQDRVSLDTVVLGDEKVVADVALGLPFSRLAQEVGGPIFANIIAAGAVCSLFQVEADIFNQCLSAMFSRKGEEILRKDILAGEKGYQLAESWPKIVLEKDSTLSSQILLNGSEAVALGCMAGGCKFISSYPMTPSTAVQTFLAEHGSEVGLVYEQAEDEIAALNMALGASYAGAPSMVATSGSGFALMTEAVGLSGMMEIPVVIYIGMRPGPAVGLPTRTAQEDLNLALYSGPGEFARAIFAPGQLEDAYQLSQRAFHLADKYQIPVFILSDQYLADLNCNLPEDGLVDVEPEKYLVETEENYQRYQLTPDGISPRGVPGYGRGLVVVDADEHDQEGHITEDLELRTRMVEKRYHKLRMLRDEALAPVLYGEDDCEVLLVGWGSTYHPLEEARRELDRDDVGVLHFQQLYPMHPDTDKYLEGKKTLIYENNIQGQLANLLKLEAGVDIQKRVLKYNGMPFSVEEVLRSVREVV
ncbi:2-oxoacid:acceptor oxidoreductase subunit alpha [Methanobacterium sp. CWC-01]|uniref:2-oxoacid:acceptor oxidoreductase subunit alpha n=1 Tax=Methanobacterium aridiramus TaxID=2584467 RepID=UPI0025774F02|nr:2-oxoacid:acceptor oxidoreductase subunit alpha [Methanobacterium sp. CWC-01]WJI08614.1 2-oxoacid:acceptor oxidoreductase subunit alpha [Methanobacterium sp. CWC-01]